jgi:hypothetical protein
MDKVVRRMGIVEYQRLSRERLAALQAENTRLRRALVKAEAAAQLQAARTAEWAVWMRRAHPEAYRELLARLCPGAS